MIADKIPMAFALSKAEEIIKTLLVKLEAGIELTSAEEKELEDTTMLINTKLIIRREGIDKIMNDFEKFKDGQKIVERMNSSN
jgi:hypothetical protein